MISITLDKVRHLKFTPNAIADAEAELNKNLLQIVQEGGVRATRALLWAGLKWEDRGLTPEKTGKLIEGWMESKPYAELEEIVARGLKEDGWFREIARQTTEEETEQDETDA